MSKIDKVDEKIENKSTGRKIDNKNDDNDDNIDSKSNKRNIKVDSEKYSKPDEKTLKEKLTTQEYEVTQLNRTEPPFKNKYWDKFEPGIYVDIVTGEPLFFSKDKFESACGWPSFSKPVNKEVVNYHEDNSFNMRRIEVRSRVGDSHLGHVFGDGPEELGGLRFCINSSSVRFIPKSEMEEEGYGYLVEFVDEF